MNVMDARVQRILTAAGRAPSVHNSQPWQVTFSGSMLTVRADPSRQMHHSDPHGREMFISCGAFLFNAVTAARRESLAPVLNMLPDPDDDLHVAEIELDPGPDPDMDELELSVAIERRATSRDPFDDQPLDVDVLQAIMTAAHDEGAGLRLIHPSDPARADVLALVRRAESLASEDAAARREEAAWTGTDESRRDGIPRGLLGPDSTDDRDPVRRFASGAGGTAKFEHRSTMAVLTTPGDSVRDWITAGQALEHLLLVATGYFVRASFATTVLENPTTRHDLGNVLSLEGAAQMLVRLGYSTSPGRAPRRSVDDIVEPAGGGGREPREA